MTLDVVSARVAVGSAAPDARAQRDWQPLRQGPLRHRASDDYV